MPKRHPAGFKKIQVKREDGKYVASCPVGSCKETRTMSTEQTAWQAIAAHAGAAHEVYAYLGD
ncbi:MAG TPA: hypothetical protein VM759_08625 [Longimicrobium sp.]|jgi:hypothetical protein|nr:hypothetical protein [Longimicrobium sp.]